MTTVLDRTTNKNAKPVGAVESHDAEAVNRKGEREVYAKRRKVYPKLAHGTFRNLKWIVMALTLGVYYGTPWLRWDRGPDLPNQAVLLDMENNRFFFFFLEIWPQEFYYVTGLLVLGALALFLATSVAGRVWCGYTCPQTVWTDLMVVIERFWQGDRNQRIKLDKEPWGLSKLFKKGMTHISWLLVGALTGGAMVFYFRDAPTLARELVTGTAPMVAYLFLAIFAVSTYVLGGIAREQVCTYMCPWPRIQGAMTDHHTLLVHYREERGEPRGPVRKGAGGVVDWSTRGDCIDCKACVAVCPAGIDIRDGFQLECIQCALCIDACNEIMDKIGRPRDLVAYVTPAKEAASKAGEEHKIPFIRARTLLYAGLFALVGLVMLVAWMRRTEVEVNVLADRNPPYVLLSDGSIRNGYTVKILNKLHEPRTYSMSLRDLDGGKIVFVGADMSTESVRVATDQLREIKVFVTVPRANLGQITGASKSFSIVVRDNESGREAVRGTLFQAPAIGR
ncbi:MAG TPA: cytochrome c oxidase accessory protein CcoG [Hyphomicrobiaceae bacterium]|nr:cytochrome c oxidase accessory protein CcoG [Hyphomicrobiaceae bacterium]